jgi:predicted transcriptional regulator
MLAMTEQKTLKDYRSELKPKVSQETMARRSSVTLVTYRKIEKGDKTTYSTAKSVLGALNVFRRTNEPRLEEIPEAEIPKIFNLN